jgi:hypothetical protein
MAVSGHDGRRHRSAFSKLIGRVARTEVRAEGAVVCAAPRRHTAAPLGESQGRDRGGQPRTAPKRVAMACQAVGSGCARGKCSTRRRGSSDHVKDWFESARAPTFWRSSPARSFRLGRRIRVIPRPLLLASEPPGRSDMSGHDGRRWLNGQSRRTTSGRGAIGHGQHARAVRLEEGHQRRTLIEACCATTSRQEGRGFDAAAARAWARRLAPMVCRIVELVPERVRAKKRMGPSQKVLDRFLDVDPHCAPDVT